MPILLDFESRSRADLKKVGGRRYWGHPSSEALCCVLFDTDTGDVELWQRGEPRPALVDRGQLGAHNATGFDKFAAERLGWSTPDHDWVDTSELARAAGLPGALDALGTRWLGLPKDKVASKFTKGLSTCRRPSGKKNPNEIPAAVWATYTPEEKRERGVMPEITSEVLARVVGYCVSDVEILAHGWPLLEPWLECEPDVRRVDRAVNERGIQFDSQLARRLLECDARLSDIALSEVARDVGLSPGRIAEIAGSPEQFAEFTGLDNAQKETLEDALASTYLSREARAMCRARQALASIARGKLEAGLARVSDDGRLRDAHRYLGAHTWRWSGRGMQTQNIPRPAKRFEDWKDAEICALVDHVLGGGWCDAQEIDILLRATLTARYGHVLVVEDFTGVESRGLAWCAGDIKAIEAILAGKDSYKVAASIIFGVPYEAVTKDQRQAGKVAELACGYQGGPGAIERFAAKLGIDLAAAGVEPAAIVTGWRKLHAPTVRFWHDVEDAFASAVRGVSARVDCFDFIPSDDGKDVAVFMPSGTPIVYNSTRFVRGHNGRQQLAFHGTKNAIEYTYGGKLVENLIQRLCREFMARALVKCNDAGLDPVMHCHDEIVSEVPASAAAEAAELQHEIMLDLPEWAETFPVSAAGHVGKRYRK